MLIDFNHSLSSLDTLDWIQIYVCIRLFFVFLPTTYYNQQTSQDHNFYSNPDSEEADEDKDLHSTDFVEVTVPQPKKSSLS